MKLKCNDGITREFSTYSYPSDIEAFCCECGEYFGYHDTKILKPKFKEHVCETSE